MNGPLPPSRHQTYALHGQYNLVPSTEATWAERSKVVPEPGGEWFAYGREGRPGSRFADLVDPAEED